MEVAAVIMTRWFTLTAVMIAAWLLSAPALASHVSHESGGEDLLQESGRVSDIELPAEAVKGSGRQGRLRAAARLEDHSWSMIVPGRGRIVAERQLQNTSPNGKSTTWLGRS